jgi:hypothetical protein
VWLLRCRTQVRIFYCEPLGKDTGIDPASTEHGERLMYDYWFEDDFLSRDGTIIETFIGGELERTIRDRCAFIDYVLHDDGPLARVGGSHVYYDRQACEAAPPPVRPSDRGC